MTNETEVSAPKAETTQIKQNAPQFTIQQLLEAGVHFGHKTMRRNPKMSKYIHTNRNGISIIDLGKTANLLNQALAVAKQTAKNNGRILFVATKRQASDTILAEAKRCGQYYVNQRWLGGMLTNWKTVSKSIKTLKTVESQLSDDESGYKKKERLILQRKGTKLDLALGGIKDMGGYPDLVFIIDIRKENLAVAEAKKLGIPIMAIIDTNVNPDGITYKIPGNDDSVKAIKLYCRLLSDAIISGIKEGMAASGVDVSKFGNELPVMKKTVDLKSSDNRILKAKPIVQVEEKKYVQKTHAKSEEKTPVNNKEGFAAKKPAAKAPAKKKPITTKK